MTFRLRSFVLFVLSAFLLSCEGGADKSKRTADKGTYAYDAEFLRLHAKNVTELISKDGKAKVLLAADYQGRVMTSTSDGDSGVSYGWLNYDLIGSGTKKKQFNPVGGEERFWLGPEGGQFSLFFRGQDSFSIKAWQVPPLLDTVEYELKKISDAEVLFSKSASLTNYSGTVFPMAISRTITLLDQDSISRLLDVPIPGTVTSVSYETDNRIINTGQQAWKKEQGLLSIWLLGMFTPSENTTVIIPFHYRPDAKSFITSDYFGKIPEDRLQIKDSVLYFTCDGKHRSKLGLSPVIAKEIAGSFDYTRNILTIISFPVEKNGSYVNSKWEMQQEPFKGDVVNSYNDGPLPDGSQLGMFYELESSSAAAELKQGETLQHRQITCHFKGDYNALRQIAQKILGVDLEDVRKKN
ncbi:MAG TPA: DUF6786 family protein [Flavitalea sp.]|nr:DUF6786 family protein [Flavitalea sp.]